MTNIIEALKWRYATKKFDTERKVSEADFNELLEAARLAPSSYGLQPWKFVVVTNPEMKATLRKASWNQSQVEDCSHYVVFLALTKMDSAYVDRFIKGLAATRGVSTESLEGYRKVIAEFLSERTPDQITEWAKRQVYIALGNLMTSAAVMGIDTCPMEGLDPAEYDRILKLGGTGYATVVGCAVGYRSLEDKYRNVPKMRFDASDLIVKY